MPASHQLDNIVNPLSPRIYVQILQTDLHTFQNLFKDQSIFS